LMCFFVRLSGDNSYLVFFMAKVFRTDRILKCLAI